MRISTTYLYGESNNIHVFFHNWYLTVPYFVFRSEGHSRCLVFLFEVPSQTASRMEYTCFNSGNRQTEPSRRFSIREPLQFVKKNHDAQTFPEMRNCSKDSGPAFAFGEGLFRGRSLIRRLEGGMHFSVIVAFLERCASTPPTDQHQRFIDSYARYPGCERRVFAKSAEICEGTLKRTLNCVFRILPIAKYPKGRTIDARSVTLV